jgi:hypothetical protein
LTVHNRDANTGLFEEIAILEYTCDPFTTFLSLPCRSRECLAIQLFNVVHNTVLETLDERFHTKSHRIAVGDRSFGALQTLKMMSLFVFYASMVVWFDTSLILLLPAVYHPWQHRSTPKMSYHKIK